MANMSVGGHRNAQVQTGRLCQNRRRSGVFAGFIFRPSRPSIRSSGPDTLMKRNGGSNHQPPYNAATKISGNMPSGR